MNPEEHTYCVARSDGIGQLVFAHSEEEARETVQGQITRSGIATEVTSVRRLGPGRIYAP